MGASQCLLLLSSGALINGALALPCEWLWRSRGLRLQVHVRGRHCPWKQARFECRLAQLGQLEHAPSQQPVLRYGHRGEPLAQLVKGPGQACLGYKEVRQAAFGPRNGPGAQLDETHSSRGQEQRTPSRVIDMSALFICRLLVDPHIAL